MPFGRVRTQVRTHRVPQVTCPPRSPPCGRASLPSPACFPASPWGLTATCSLCSGPCGLASPQRLTRLPAALGVRKAGGPSRRSCSTEIRTPGSTRATAIWLSRSRGQRRPWTYTQEWSTAGRPGGMPTAAPSTPARADRRSLSSGLSMEPAMPGRAAAPPDPSPIREGLTLRGRCSASSLSTHIPRRVPMAA
jgi:hypothetical protein